MKKIIPVEIPEGYDAEITFVKKKSGRWKPEEGERYFFVGDEGEVDDASFDYGINYPSYHERRLKVGNCFRSEEEAKKSYIYFAINSEYEYWHPGMEPPEDKEGWDCYHSKEWLKPSDHNLTDDTDLTRRRLKNRGEG